MDGNCLCVNLFDVYNYENCVDINKLKILKDNFIEEFYSYFREYVFDCNEIYIDICSKAMTFISAKFYLNCYIDDEYMILNFLMKFSRVNDIVIQVSDSYGEFVLIDASEELDGLISKSEKYNMYIRDEKLICLLGNEIDLKKDINNILSNLYNREISMKLTEYLQTRVKDIDNLIYFNVIIPEQIARILHKTPQFVSDFIENYDDKLIYSKQYIDKESNKMFDNLITYPVKFTKNHFAKLFTDKHFPPKHSKWSQHPLSTSISLIIGYKLTIGYLITIELSTKTFNSKDKKWQKFYESLKKNDYFKNEIEGSQEYNRLYEQAIHNFNNIIKNESSIKLFNTKLLTCNIDSSDDFNYQLHEDDDLSWLRNGIDDVEKMIKNKYNSDSIQTTFSSVKLDSFVDHKSNIDGVDFDDPSIYQNINLNPTLFEESLNKLFDDYENFNVSDSSDEDDLDESEIQEISDQMKQIGEILNVDSVNISDKSSIENLFRSYDSQTSSGGPVFNLFSQIGVDPQNEKINFHKK